MTMNIKYSWKLNVLRKSTIVYGRRITDHLRSEIDDKRLRIVSNIHVYMKFMYIKLYIYLYETTEENN